MVLHADLTTAWVEGDLMMFSSELFFLELTPATMPMTAAISRKEVNRSRKSFLRDFDKETCFPSESDIPMEMCLPGSDISEKDWLCLVDLCLV